MSRNRVDIGFAGSEKPDIFLKLKQSEHQTEWRILWNLKHKMEKAIPVNWQEIARNKWRQNSVVKHDLLAGEKKILSVVKLFFKSQN